MRITVSLPALCLMIALILAVSGCSSTQPNATVPATVTSDPAVSQVLAVSCYDCHSNEGAGKWYAKLQPSRWFGDRALASLNFSDWGTYDAQHRTDAIRQIAAVVDAGTMPPGGFLLLHPAARLSADQKAAIAKWAAAQGTMAAH